jgi:N-acyl-D-amino-acid deacylase
MDPLPTNAVVDARLHEITVRQLLQHTAGWDREQTRDPMFASVDIARALGAEPPATTHQIIRYMLTQPLQFDPGARFAYSNFGYCLLGRIVEAKTGLSYEQFVQNEVLQPRGIQRMRLGRTRETAPFEVHYYEGDQKPPSVFADNLGQDVPVPYGAWCLESMDAHGGWIASVVDLMRLSVALHARAEPRLLRDETYALAFARPAGLPGSEADGAPRSSYYACGWQVRPSGGPGGFNCWHMGSLPGTSTLLVRRHDHRHWAVLFNSRLDGQGQPPAALLDPLLHEAVDAVTEWPREDQFPQYFPEYFADKGPEEEQKP